MDPYLNPTRLKTYNTSTIWRCFLAPISSQKQPSLKRSTFLIFINWSNSGFPQCIFTLSNLDFFYSILFETSPCLTCLIHNGGGLFGEVVDFCCCRLFLFFITDKYLFLRRVIIYCPVLLFGLLPIWDY